MATYFGNNFGTINVTEASDITPSLFNYGTVNIWDRLDNLGLFESYGFIYNNDQLFNNDTLVNINGGHLYNYADADIENYGEIYNYFNLYNYGYIYNHDSFLIDNGNGYLYNYETLENNGLVIVGDDFYNSVSGLLSGNGIYQGDIYSSEGMIAPGGIYAVDTEDSLTIEGSYVQSASTASIDLSFDNSLSHDVLNITELAVIEDGDINLIGLSDFLTSCDDFTFGINSFILIDAGSLSIIPPTLMLSLSSFVDSYDSPVFDLSIYETGTQLILTVYKLVDDTIVGTEAPDYLIGTPCDDIIQGLGGDDTIQGQDGNDTISGGDGNDGLQGNGGADFLQGNSGNDRLQGDGGADTLFGGDGNDRLHGNGGADFLQGNSGNDRLRGNGGADTLYGNAGDDTLVGGDGMDKFWFNSPTEGVDTINDFTEGDDLIVVDSSGFGGGLTAESTITPSEFHSGAGAIAPTTPGHRFIYNNTTGDLFFDPDGTGFLDTVHFATLSTMPILSNTDIFVN